MATTTLTITPAFAKKTAKFKGTIAAGEHVAVSIQNDDEYVASITNLRLRVVDPACGRTLAVFPQPVEEGETPETWGEDLTPLTCELNLNTVQMLKAVPPTATVPLLFVLDDKESDTLYFKDLCDVTHWPMELGEDVPYNLVGYPDFVEEAKQAIKDAQDAIESAVDEATGIVAQATEARSTAQTAASNSANSALQATNAKNAAQNAQAAAETAQGKAEDAQEAAEAAQAAAERAQEAAESAAESINSPDATLTEEGVAADAKAAGDAIAAEKERAETAEAAEKARAQGAEQTLNANKADKATTYTKTEVDTKIAGVQTFKKYLVQTLPDPDEADMKGLYLVPTGETSEEGDLCEEWTVVEENGEKRWEKIGGTTVDLSDYYDKDAVDGLLDDKQDALTFDNAPTSGSNNPVKSGGIWSALWGALSALPTGFSSLYDWCVAQLAGKLSLSGGTMTGPLTLKRGIAAGGDAELYGDGIKNLDNNAVYAWPTQSGAGRIALAADMGHAGNIAALDADGNPTDSGKKPSDFQSALTPQQLANIAAVSGALAFDATNSYAAGDPVVYNGMLYTFTAAHTGAWTGSDVSVVDIIARLAGKLDKSGGTMTGPLAVDFSA